MIAFVNNSSLTFSDHFFIETGKSGEQHMPFLFYRSAVFADHWLVTDSNKDLCIGENDAKKVETTQATMIQWFNSSLLYYSFFDKDVQEAFDYVPCSSQCNMRFSWPKNYVNCKKLKSKTNMMHCPFNQWWYHDDTIATNNNLLCHTKGII